jgi:plasmid stabilization system protein ParE
MMNYTLVFHEKVETDLNEAYNWYEDKQEGLGERFLTELAECYHLLESHPEYYSIVVKKYRRIVLKRFLYVIVFEIAADIVFVYAVFHTNRNPKEILKRKKTDQR